MIHVSLSECWIKKECNNVYVCYALYSSFLMVETRVKKGIVSERSPVPRELQNPSEWIA